MSVLHDPDGCLAHPAINNVQALKIKYTKQVWSFCPHSNIARESPDRWAIALNSTVAVIHAASASGLQVAHNPQNWLCHVQHF